MPMVLVMNVIVVVFSLFFSSLSFSEDKGYYFDDSKEDLRYSSEVNVEGDSLSSVKSSKIYDILDPGDIFYLESLPAYRRDRMINRLEKTFEKGIYEKARKDERNMIAAQIRSHKKLSKGGIIRFSNGTVLVPEKTSRVSVDPVVVNGQIFHQREQDITISPRRVIRLGNIEDLSEYVD